MINVCSLATPEIQLKTKHSEISVGAVYPLSGTLAPIGRSIRQAVELAVDLVNHPDDMPSSMACCFPRYNCHKKRINLIWADSQGDPQKGRTETRRLIEKEGAAAVLGSYQSSVTALASMEAEALQVPFLNPESSAHTLTWRGFEWFFRTGSDDITYTQVIFDFFNSLKQQGNKLQRMAIISEDSITGSEASEVELNMIKHYGFSLVDLEMYKLPVSSLQMEIERIRRVDPEVILGSQSFDDAVLLPRTLRQMGYFPDGLVVQDAGYTTPAFLEETGLESEYIISRSSWAPGITRINPLAARINSLYRTRYGDDLDDINARSFTGMVVLAEAIARARSTSPYDIRTALRNTYIPPAGLIMPWKGVRFNRSGQNTLTRGLLVQILAQHFRIIWPPQLTETRAIWPAP